jgi:hypothetical protein
MEEDECMICLEVLEGTLCKLSCGHIYHYNCVQKWMINNKNYKNACCICKNTEIENIYNTNELYNYRSNVNLIDDKKKNKKKKIKKYNCCVIL